MLCHVWLLIQMVDDITVIVTIPITYPVRPPLFSLQYKRAPTSERMRLLNADSAALEMAASGSMYDATLKVCIALSSARY